MKILVPTDFSDRTTTALDEAGAWARDLGATLTLLHVVAPHSWPVLAESDVEDEITRVVREKLEALRAQLAPATACEIHVAHGVPHAEIVRFATESSIDLIVLPTHGRSALKRFLLGSTTERVARTAACSVMVVRGDGQRHGPGAWNTILTATDFHEPSLLAVERAANLADFGGAELLVVHVLRDADYPVYRVLSPRLWEDVRRHCTKQLASTVLAHAKNTRSDSLVVEGVPSAKIADVAEEYAADIIVVGPAEDTGKRRATLGSTAERLARIAHCSVLIVRGNAPWVDEN